MNNNKPEKVIPDKVLNYKIPDIEHDFSSKDAIIYALAIGFSRDPLNEDDLRFTYELKDDFTVFPTTFTTSLTLDKIFEPLINCPGMPNFNPLMILHGEHKLEILNPIQLYPKSITSFRIADIADKGSGALVTFELTTQGVSEDGKKIPLVRNTLSLFVRGIGGFGYKGINLDVIPKIPERKPDVVVEEKTLPNQALFYRLCGDINPLHADPKMAESVGFEKPILHGLCFYGISTKLILRAVCGGDTTKFKSVKARFTSYIFPGETIQVSGWKDGSKIIFSGKTTEREKQIIHGIIELNETPSPKL